MIKILRIVVFFVAAIITTNAMALDVVLKNELEDEYIVVTQLYAFGVNSFIPSNPLVIPPKTDQPAYVVRIKAGEPVLYELAISVAKDLDHVNEALPICKASYQKDKSSWFSFASSPYICFEDTSVYQQDEVPFSVVVAKKDQLRQAKNRGEQQ